MADTLQQDAERLYEAVCRLVRVYQFRDRERICCHDISVTQCYALEYLVESGPMRLNALSELMMLDKSTASRVIDSLVRKKLAARVEDSQDRRAVRLAATDRGRTLYRRIRKDLVREDKALIAAMPAEVRTASIRLIERLAHTAQRRLDVGSCATDSGTDCT